MALIYDIIKDAYREANLIPIAQAPSDDEQAEALRLLNRYVKSVFGNEAGDEFQTLALGKNNIVSTTDSLDIFYPDAGTYIPLNVRILANLEGAVTINLHPAPNDGSRVSIIDLSQNFDTRNLTINGNGRRIGTGTSTTLSTAGVNSEWFYRADLGSWALISDLALSDELPFPEEFEDMFVIGLAIRLNPRNGAALDQQTMLTYRRMQNLFKARYHQTIPQESEEGLLRLPSLFRGVSFFSRS